MAGDPTFVLVMDTLTGRQALEKAAAATYLVIQFADGHFAGVKPGDLRTKLNMWKMLDTPLKDVPANVFAPHLIASVAEESDDPQVRARIAALKPNELLVAVKNGNFNGLYIGGKVFRSVNQSSGPMKLSVEEAGSPAPAAPEKRFINVEMKDGNDQLHNPAEKPLKKDDVYTLSFDVDVELRKTAIAVKGAEFQYQFQEGEQMVTLTVRLESDDFEFYDGQEKKLLVPRTGKSRNRALFQIQPKHDGDCQINAVFLKDGNFVQVMNLRFYVGELFTAKTLGRDVAAAYTVQARDVSLTILNTGMAFQAILVTPGTGATAAIPVKLPELKDIASQARQELLEVVNLEQGGRAVYQEMLDIPEAAHRLALQKLAAAGFRLYQRIFFGPAADEQCKNLGRRLRELAQKEKLKIQIFSQDFVLPWGLLYVADRFDPNNVNPEYFLGFKHIIEHIPLQQNLRVTDNRIANAGGLNVSLNVNTDIDRDMGQPFVGNQLDYWERLCGGGASVKLVERTTRDEVTLALSNPATPDQVLYFYCHGISKDVDEKGGVDASTLVLSGNGRLTLEDLNLFAPADDALPNAPLVFINACESAQLSPLVYDGFVPYFMSKGARGVIGTEVETPALFAVEWARRFFDHFLKGEPLGETFLTLRREFLADHRNLMGLLYALYVDGDTRIENPAM